MICAMWGCEHMYEETGGMNLPEWSALPDIGLYMDQVVTLMDRTFAAGEITKSMVNNYVKSGLLKRPVGKKYEREQLAQLIMIGVLKQALSMDDIASLLVLLCAEGTQAGYAGFCSMVAAVDGAHEQDGSAAQRFADPDTPQERAVLYGVAASVCAMRARGMLAQLDQVKEC